MVPWSMRLSAQMDAPAENRSSEFTGRRQFDYHGRDDHRLHSHVRLFALSHDRKFLPRRTVDGIFGP